MSFTTNTLDRTIYRSVYKTTGKTIYLLRKFDYFVLYCYNESVAKYIYNQIGDALQLPGESDKPFTHLGIVTDFNEIYIEQSCDYIQI